MSKLLGLMILIGLLAPNFAYTPGLPYRGSLILIQNNTLVRGQIWASDLKSIIELDYPELYDIIVCESNWRNVCNQKYGCPAGQGIAQIIPSTWEFVQANGVKVGSPFNEEDNLKAAIWLYERYGNKPWLQSQSCWNYDHN